MKLFGDATNLSDLGFFRGVIVSKVGSDGDGQFGIETATVKTFNRNPFSRRNDKKPRKIYR